MGELSISKSIR